MYLKAPRPSNLRFEDSTLQWGFPGQAPFDYTETKFIFKAAILLLALQSPCSFSGKQYIVRII